MRQLAIAIVIALVAIIFALQNAEPVTVNILFWELTNTSMALVLMITLIIGIISGLLFLAPGIYKRNKTIQEQKRRILELQK
jgi:lipopolysaccharide assembly protein A